MQVVKEYPDMTDASRSSIRIAGLVDSLRQASYNRALLRAAMTLQPDGMEITDVNLRYLPLFDGDLETAGDTPAIVAFKEQIAAADALPFVTPEYNYSIPGVLKDESVLSSGIVADHSIRNRFFLPISRPSGSR